jgi:hypothetical protein
LSTFVRDVHAEAGLAAGREHGVEESRPVAPREHDLRLAR